MKQNPSFLKQDVKRHWTMHGFGSMRQRESQRGRFGLQSVRCPIPGAPFTEMLTAQGLLDLCWRWPEISPQGQERPFSSLLEFFLKMLLFPHLISELLTCTEFSISATLPKSGFQMNASRARRLKTHVD